MNITAMEGDSLHDISGDFNDALSIIAATDPDYLNKTNNNNNNNNNNYNTNIQPMQQHISSQCFVEEQQQRCRVTQQMFAEQSQADAHHQMLQVAYEEQFMNQNHQALFQQEQQQFLAYQQQFQRQNQMNQVQNQVAQACQMQNQDPQVGQPALQMQNQDRQVSQPAPQIQNQAIHVDQAMFQMQNQVAQVHQIAPQIQNQAAQICQVMPQMQNQVAQVHEIVPSIQNQATQAHQAHMQNQAIQMHQAPQVHQVAPHVQNQLAQARQAVPQIQDLAVQAQQALPFQQSQDHQLNCYQQSQLQNQSTQPTLTRNQQQLLAAYQQLYGSSSQVQNQQQQQQRQQQTPRNFSLQTAPVCTQQNNYSMMPQQQQLQQKQETTVQQSVPIVQQTVPESNVQIQKSQPYIEIVEQPASRGSRFRYGCEIRTRGTIPGVNSTPDNKTYPTIRVVGYNGEAVVVVSCVTKDKPYRAHPHNLVGKVLCKNGVCKATMSKDNMTVTFDKLGIQCIKRKDILNSLNQREKIKVDPFNNGFATKHNPASFDLNCVRLAFQVFLEGPAKGQYKLPLAPIVSQPIYDKKNSPDLSIYRLSHCSALASGGQEIILLCDKVIKEDIHVRFYEERGDELVWEDFGDLNKTGIIHKHVAILYQCPKYKMTDFNGVAHVYIELVRPSDGVCSNPVPFTFIPANDPISMKKKRKRIHDSLSDSLMKNLEAAVYADQWNQPNFNRKEAQYIDSNKLLTNKVQEIYT